MASIKANLNGLNDIIQTLKQNYTVRVGILGSEAEAKHEDSGLTNADLGAVHEFGATIHHPGGTPYVITENGARFVSKNVAQYATKDLPTTQAHDIEIPARSFLYEPLAEKMNFNNLSDDKMQKLKNKAFKMIFIDNKGKAFFRDLGAHAVQIVKEGFNTGGYGQWKELTAATKRYKDKNNLSPQILRATGQLSRSISFKVIPK